MSRQDRSDAPKLTASRACARTISPAGEGGRLERSVAPLTRRLGRVFGGGGMVPAGGQRGVTLIE
jgi:hypothetical protein